MVQKHEEVGQGVGCWASERTESSRIDFCVETVKNLSLGVIIDYRYKVRT